MIDVLSVENMRKSDAYTIATKTSGAELMLRAARGVFIVCKESPFAIVCGTGNNAGDGYALATLLKDAGKDVTIFLVKEKFSEDGKFYYDRCVEKGIDIEMLDKIDSLRGYRTVVDCLLGTGFKGSVREDVKQAIDKINDSGAYVISVDINSGLNGDSGMGESFVKSDLTVSIGGYKPGHFLNMAKDAMKEKMNVNIGIDPVDEPYRLIDAADVAPYFEERSNFSNKGTYGYTALIGGSEMYGGAIRLAYMANAAMRSGAGVVKIAIPRSIAHDVAPNILESTLFLLPEKDGKAAYDEEALTELTKNVKTVAIGPGTGQSEDIKKTLAFLLNRFEGKLIIDADGLNTLSAMGSDALKNAKCKTVLTPHIKEFSRLTGKGIDEILADPIAQAKEYAASNDTVLLLKGPSTIITDGNTVNIVDRGCAGMATAGSGDVLTGILSALVSYIDDTLMAVTSGAYINGLAGELAERQKGQISMIASDTVSNIHNAVLLIMNI